MWPAPRGSCEVRDLFLPGPARVPSHGLHRPPPLRMLPERAGAVWWGWGREGEGEPSFQHNPASSHMGLARERRLLLSPWRLSQGSRDPHMAGPGDDTHQGGLLRGSGCSSSSRLGAPLVGCDREAIGCGPAVAGGGRGGCGGRRLGSAQAPWSGGSTGPRTCCVYRPGFGSDLALSCSKAIHRASSWGPSVAETVWRHGRPTRAGQDWSSFPDRSCVVAEAAQTSAPLRALTFSRQDTRDLISSEWKSIGHPQGDSTLGVQTSKPAQIPALQVLPF